MITPDPILLEGESGREFSFELGRNEDVKIEKEKTPVDPTTPASPEAQEAEGQEEEEA